MNYQEYIRTELLILIPVLYLIGIGLKKSRLPDNWIPVTLGVIAVLLSAVWVIAACDIGTYKELAAAFFTAVPGQERFVSLGCKSHISVI